MPSSDSLGTSRSNRGGRSSPLGRDRTNACSSSARAPAAFPPRGISLLGHSVVVQDAGPVAGGMMHFGIPRYRLPREVLRAEIARIANLGVRIVLNHTVNDLLAERARGQFDVVFLGVGAHLSKRLDIPARDAGRIYDALQFLKEAEFGGELKIGRRVARLGRNAENAAQPLADR